MNNGRPARREDGTAAKAQNPSDYNPRYLSYCRTEGVADDPEATLALDGERWPGGCMTGFLLWMPARWREWFAATGRTTREEREILTDEDHAEFDRWLFAR